MAFDEGLAHQIRETLMDQQGLGRFCTIPATKVASDLKTEVRSALVVR